MYTRRNRLRWRGYNYRTPGSYYVTLCVEGRSCLFGQVRDGRMHLNQAGAMVARVWEAIPKTFPHVGIGDFVVMPNHLHGILMLKDAEPTYRVLLGSVIRWFKYRTTLEYGRGVRVHGWPSFDRRLWQRGFHDRVIRNEQEHAHAAGYIRRNPGAWRKDPLRPDAR